MHLLHPIQKQSVILADCLDDTLQTCHIPPGVLMEINNLDNLPPVFAGYQVLRMVFANLIDNAIHAMQENGSIQITAEQVPDAILVQIKDNGPGIPDEIQRKIFEFQFSRSHPQVKQRMGFGLWWVRTIMARLGGAVWVQSDGEHGTVFTLQFPIDGSVS